MPTSDPLVFVRYLDVVLVVLAAPFVLLMGGAGARLRRRGRRPGSSAASLGAAIERSASAPRTRARRSASNFAVLMGRAWLIGIAILVVGLAGEREDGLMAALLALVAFTVYLGHHADPRPMERNTPSP